MSIGFQAGTREFSSILLAKILARTGLTGDFTCDNLPVVWCARLLHNEVCLKIGRI